MEPSPELPTRLSTRHTRRGSELAPPPKRLKPPHDVMSSPDPLRPSSQPHPIELMDSSADPLHGEGNINSSTSRDATSDSLCDAGLLLCQFLAPTAVQHSVPVRREGEGGNEEDERGSSNSLATCVVKIALLCKHNTQIHCFHPTLWTTLLPVTPHQREQVTLVWINCGKGVFPVTGSQGAGVGDRLLL